jgi:hypothetical protein
MTVTIDTTAETLHAVLGADLSEACSRLAQARAQQDQKDTPDNRSTVAECRSQIDALLDMYLEAGKPRRSGISRRG